MGPFPILFRIIFIYTRLSLWADDQAQTKPNIMSNVAHISWLIHVLQMNFNVLLYIWEGGIEVELYLNGFFCECAKDHSEVVFANNNNNKMMEGGGDFNWELYGE